MIPTGFVGARGIGRCADCIFIGDRQSPAAAWRALRILFLDGWELFPMTAE
jgi:hypothetical protein